jgi:hypothetical protein
MARLLQTSTEALLSNAIRCHITTYLKISTKEQIHINLIDA